MAAQQAKKQAEKGQHDRPQQPEPDLTSGKTRCSRSQLNGGSNDTKALPFLRKAHQGARRFHKSCFDAKGRKRSARGVLGGRQHLLLKGDAPRAALDLKRIYRPNSI